MPDQLEIHSLSVSWHMKGLPYNFSNLTLTGGVGKIRIG
jgi:hypothetical protein